MSLSSTRDISSWVDSKFMTLGLPISLCLVLGPVVAFLIAAGQGAFAAAIALAVPLAIIFLRYPFAAIMVWLLVAPLFQNTATAAARYVFWLVHRGMIPLAIVLILVSSWTNRGKRILPRLGRAELAAVAFIALAVFSILSEEPLVTDKLYTLYDRVVVPFLVYVFVRLNVPREKDLGRLTAILWLVCTAESIIGILSWYLPGVLPAAWRNMLGQRTTGTLSTPYVYTSMLILCMLIMLQYGIHHRVSAIRRTLLLTCVLGACCIFLSFSRGSWLAGVVVGLALLAMYPRTMIRLYAFISVLVIILGVTTGLLSSLWSWAYERLYDKQTTDARLGVIFASVRMVQAKPLFGWGYENFDLYESQFESAEDRGLLGNWRSTSHNTYMTIVTELGLVGFLLYSFPYLWWLRLTFQVIRRMPRQGVMSWRLLVLLWLIILFNVIVSNFGDLRFFTVGLTLPWLTLGLIAPLVQTYLRPGDSGPPAWVKRIAASSYSDR